MILVASEKCDVVMEYPEWLFNRIYDGNVSYIDNKIIKNANINQDTVDCIVFKTRNPKNLIKNSRSLRFLGYDCIYEIYFSPYGYDIEPNIGNKREILRDTIELSNIVGPEHIVWHYSPVFVNDNYNIQFHKKAYTALTKALFGCFGWSCIDMYLKNYNAIGNINILNDKEEISLIKYANRLSLTNNYNLAINLKKQKDKDKAKFWGDILNKDFEGCNIIDLGIDGGCSGNCRYCDKRNNIMSQKVKENYNPNSIFLFQQKVV